MIGFDIERHVYGDHRYPAQLVVQDVLTLDGAQFRDADLIVASPPCQEYSYMAMPWKRAKRIAAALRGEDEFPEGYTGSCTLADLNALFDACFRIQREASDAAGRHIPLIVENVRGAQPWVGRARWNFGSYYLWGDVPALMPPTFRGERKSQTGSWDATRANYNPDHGWKSQGMNWSDRKKRGQDFTRIAGGHAIKNNGGSWFNIGSPGQKVTGQNPDGRKTRRHPNKRDGHDHTRYLTNPAEHGVKQRGSGRARFDKALDERRKNPDGIKNPSIELGDIGFNVASAEQFGHMAEGVKIERSEEDKCQHIGTKRKFASAMIAKIPPPLSRHIAMTFGRSLTTAAPPC